MPCAVYATECEMTVYLMLWLSRNSLSRVSDIIHLRCHESFLLMIQGRILNQPRPPSTRVYADVCVSHDVNEAQSSRAHNSKHGTQSRPARRLCYSKLFFARIDWQNPRPATPEEFVSQPPKRMRACTRPAV